MSDITPPAVRCAKCGTAPTKPPTSARPPRGWKRLSETVLWCGACVQAGYQIRAITVPIASVLEAGGWAAFGAAARDAWAETTACANWIATTLYARDVRRAPDETRLRPMPPVYLYPEARTLFPGISPINLTALLQQIEQTYRRRRYELLWQRSVTLPTYRYPVPAPIHAQAWRLEEPTSGAIVAHVRLGDRWWALRLTGWSRRYLAGLRQIIAGETLPAAAALLSVTHRPSDHRAAGTRGRRLMLKLVARFPRPPAATGAEVVTVQTAASSFLRVLRADGDPVRLHADRLRQTIAAWEVQRARWAQELSVVRRWVPAERRALQTRLIHGAARHQARVRTQLQQLAATVAGIAARDRAGQVVYEDEERGFQQPFPWRQWRETLRQAIEAQGMAWRYASDETGVEEAEALAEAGS